MMERPIPYKKLIILALLLICAVGAAALVHFAMRSKPPAKQAQEPRKESLTIFFPAREGGLTRKSVELKGSASDREKADIIIRELKKEQAVPEKVALHEFAADGDGVLYLNLSQDMKSGATDAATEVITVYSVVNSFLSNFSGAKSVQILVEGQAVYTLHGLLYTYLPLEFNNQLLEE
jgi:hypothetical protein